MSSITFITWNASKAEYLEKYLELEIGHVKIDLDEIQSMNLEEIVTHKVKQAYEIVKTPVLVEDVSLEFEALGWLPGPFVKFFLEKMSLQDICGLLDQKPRNARARCVVGYYDGDILELFEWTMSWKISKNPAGDNGFGWDKIFMPNWYDGKTNAELWDTKTKEVYFKLRKIDDLKVFLEKIQSNK